MVSYDMGSPDSMNAFAVAPPHLPGSYLVLELINLCSSARCALCGA